MDIPPSIVDTLRAASRELDVRPTGASPRLVPLPDIRAVLFDVYGTLLISASGEVGTASRLGSGDAWQDSLRAVGIERGSTEVGSTEPGSTEVPGAERLESVIRRHHARARERGVDFPEVDIVEVWRETLEQLIALRQVPPSARQVNLAQLAVEYESRTNPTWPMPGLEECLRQLRQRGLTLGLISNAQFFTPLLFPALLDATLDDLGVDAELRFYSFEHGRAKPGEFLYRRAADACRRRGLAERQVLYVGNDMLNDVLPAVRTGFRTALFAGDGRSLRRREGDPRVGGVEPDLVLTDLRSLLECVGRS